jgi:hypothetical protein
MHDRTPGERPPDGAIRTPHSYGDRSESSESMR